MTDLPPPTGYFDVTAHFRGPVHLGKLDTTKWIPGWATELYRWGNLGTLPWPYSG